MTDKTLEERVTNMLDWLSRDTSFDVASIKELIKCQQARIEELEKQQQWQPIETAPVDITILVYTHYDVLIMTRESDNLDLFIDDTGMIEIHIDELFGWQPSPQPPKECE